MLFNFQISVVKRGCKNLNDKINGKESDGEGCEEILRDSTQTYFEQIICLCKTDLCNKALPLKPSNDIIPNTFLYSVVFQFVLQSLRNIRLTI